MSIIRLRVFFSSPFWVMHKLSHPFIRKRGLCKKHSSILDQINITCFIYLPHACRKQTNTSTVIFFTSDTTSTSKTMFHVYASNRLVCLGYHSWIKVMVRAIWIAACDATGELSPIVLHLWLSFELLPILLGVSKYQVDFLLESAHARHCVQVWNTFCTDLRNWPQSGTFLPTDFSLYLCMRKMSLLHFFEQFQNRLDFLRRNCPYVISVIPRLLQFLENIGGYVVPWTLPLRK